MKLGDTKRGTLVIIHKNYEILGRKPIFRAIICFLFAFLCFNLSVFTEELKKDQIPDDLLQKAKEFYEMIVIGNPEQIYAQFDEKLKNEVTIDQLKTLLSKIPIFKVINYSNYKFKEAEYLIDEGGIYVLLFHAKANGQSLAYLISLRKQENSIFVRGFNLTSIPLNAPPHLFSLENARPIHFITFISFFLCIAIQIGCCLYFIRRKSLKKKWLYIVISFLGFPIGFTVVWITGALSINFGFKIPAVALSKPLVASGLWAVTVFFPVGLIVAFVEKARSKRQINREKDTNELKLESD